MPFDVVDPRCPECGGPTGADATYCIHCSAEFDPSEIVDANEQPIDDADSTTGSQNPVSNVRTASGRSGTAEHPLDPDGAVDNTLTVIVGIIGGVVIGLLGLVVLIGTTGSGWSVPVGVLGWLLVTAYLVRRRYVLDAVAKSGYGIALTLLLVPLITVSPATSGGNGIAGQALSFVVLLIIVAIPAAIIAGLAWFASRYVPATSENRTRSFRQ